MEKVWSTQPRPTSIVFADLVAFNIFAALSVVIALNINSGRSNVSMISSTLCAIISDVCFPFASPQYTHQESFQLKAFTNVVSSDCQVSLVVPKIVKNSYK